MDGVVGHFSLVSGGGWRYILDWWGEWTFFMGGWGLVAVVTRFSINYNKILSTYFMNSDSSAYFSVI